jgi:hypothetical protein
MKSYRVSYANTDQVVIVGARCGLLARWQAKRLADAHIPDHGPVTKTERVEAIHTDDHPHPIKYIPWMKWPTPPRYQLNLIQPCWFHHCRPLAPPVRQKLTIEWLKSGLLCPVAAGPPPEPKLTPTQKALVFAILNLVKGEPKS